MTRFARAKGSKSSNERKPEDATPWSEMRKSLLPQNKEMPENNLLENNIKINNEQKSIEWAPLGDDSFHDSQLLLKPHLNEKGSSTKIVSKKKLEEKTADYGLKKKGTKQKPKKPKSEPEINESKFTGNKKKRKKVESEGDFEEEEAPKKKKTEVVDTKYVKKKKWEGGDEAKVGGGRNFQKKEKKSSFKKSEEFKKNYQGGKTQFPGKLKQQLKKKGKFQNKSFEEGRSVVEDLVINGEKIEIVKFQGFYITLEDAERLKKLRIEMKKEGIPRAKLEAAIKLERRRAEKALSRLKKSVCFHCRGRGHLLSSCPELMEKESAGTGICYKCGSTEHSAGECKVVKGTNFQFAECFICKEQGHIARQCPDNPRGLYPQGGACRECGDVTHLRKDCPQVLSQKAEEVVTVGLRNDRNLECLDEELVSAKKQQNPTKEVKKKSTVKF